jgi:hypothetical protein
MNFNELISDQLYMWSVLNVRTHHLCSQATPQAIAAQVAAARRCASGLLGRTLQALRQSQLQVRRRSRPWTEVLPVGELSGPVAADGLRPSSRPRPSERARGQLRSGSRDPGGDLRDQPRTAASARTTLRRNGEPGTTPVAHRPHRYLSCCDAARQHARRPYRGRADAHTLRGGQR